MIEVCLASAAYDWALAFARAVHIPASDPRVKRFAADRLRFFALREPHQAESLLDMADMLERQAAQADVPATAMPRQ